MIVLDLEERQYETPQERKERPRKDLENRGFIRSKEGPRNERSVLSRICTARSLESSGDFLALVIVALRFALHSRI